MDGVAYVRGRPIGRGSGQLGAGRSRDEVVVRDGEMVIRHILPLSLTFDHRAVTGGEAARFMNAVIEDLEK